MRRRTDLGAVLHNLYLNQFADRSFPFGFLLSSPMSTTLYANSFPSDPLSSSSRLQAVHQQPEIHQENPALEEQYTTLFCRALYDYEAQDASALSFRTDDIIEVLTQQPSGWWDGLLGEERGWFPSNYVTIISDEEAELAFSQAGSATVDGQNSESQPQIPVDAPLAMTARAQAEQEEWLDNEISYRNGGQETHRTANQGGNQPSDFWMPEVTDNGQVSNAFEMTPS